MNSTRKIKSLEKVSHLTKSVGHVKSVLLKDLSLLGVINQFSWSFFNSEKFYVLSKKLEELQYKLLYFKLECCHPFAMDLLKFISIYFNKLTYFSNSLYWILVKGVGAKSQSLISVSDELAQW